MSSNIISPELSAAEYSSECSITFESFQALAERKELVAISCGHKFARVAIVDWLKREATCPNCRQNVDKGSLVEVTIKISEIAKAQLPKGVASSSSSSGSASSSSNAHFRGIDVKKINGDLTPDEALEVALRASIEQSGAAAAASGSSGSAGGGNHSASKIARKAKKKVRNDATQMRLALSGHNVQVPPQPPRSASAASASSAAASSARSNAQPAQLSNHSLSNVPHLPFSLERVRPHLDEQVVVSLQNIPPPQWPYALQGTLQVIQLLDAILSTMPVEETAIVRELCNNKYKALRENSVVDSNAGKISLIIRRIRDLIDVEIPESTTGNNIKLAANRARKTLLNFMNPGKSEPIMDKMILPEDDQLWECLVFGTKETPAPHPEKHIVKLSGKEINRINATGTAWCQPLAWVDLSRIGHKDFEETKYY